MMVKSVIDEISRAYSTTGRKLPWHKTCIKYGNWLYFFDKGHGMLQTHMHVTRPATTAHLAQTMTLLSLTSEELRQQIDTELSHNPALELVEERRCPVCHRLLTGKGPCPICSSPQAGNDEEPVVYISPREDFTPQKDYYEDDFRDDPVAPEVEDLPTYVLRQIGADLDRVQQRIAAHILLNLDEDGLLNVTIVDIARYFNTTISAVEAVQKIIQRADPLGVGSRNPREALLVQLEVLEESQPAPEMVKCIIENYLDDLSRRQYPQLAHTLKISLRQVKLAGEFISNNLNPFPARSHWGDNRQPAPVVRGVYHQPDIIITSMDNGKSGRLMVEIIMPLWGTLRVNPIYRQAIKMTEQSRREDLKGDLERASLFIKCLQQRNHTMQRLMQRVVGIQHQYIVYGEKYIHSLTRAQIARELEVHESTISRAVSGKSVQIPNGRIIPLSSFFDRSLNVRTVLKGLVENEPRPLSDTELAKLLKGEGYEVARRTVAKYRAMEGILPAHLRTAVVRTA
jgi:RNA polymerase sigma-54 factor